jgi:hypothetical protein
MPRMMRRRGWMGSMVVIGDGVRGLRRVMGDGLPSDERVVPITRDHQRDHQQQYPIEDMREEEEARRTKNGKIQS